MAPAVAEPSTAWLWPAEAQALVPHMPKQLMCRLLIEAIATKKLRWDGPAGWKRPDHIDFDSPKVWRSSTWNLSEGVVRLSYSPGRRFTFYIRLNKDDFLRLIGLLTAEHPADPAQEDATGDAGKEAASTADKAADVASSTARVRQKRQQASHAVDRIKPVIKRLYPEHGLVPMGVTTERVRNRVNKDKEFVAESERLGLGEAKRDSTSRAIDELQEAYDLAHKHNS